MPTIRPDQYGDYTPNFQGGIGRMLNRGILAQQGTTNRAIFQDADIYRNALEKAAYGGASREFGQGLGAIQNQLAGAGPLADSGVANTMRAKLLGGVYGAAQGRIQSGFADYLRQALNARQQYRYQQMLQKQAQKAQGGIGGFLGGALGGILPGIGPLLGKKPVLSGYDAAIAAGPEYNWDPRGT